MRSPKKTVVLWKQLSSKTFIIVHNRSFFGPPWKCTISRRSKHTVDPTILAKWMWDIAKQCINGCTNRAIIETYFTFVWEPSVGGCYHEAAWIMRLLQTGQWSAQLWPQLRCGRCHFFCATSPQETKYDQQCRDWEVLFVLEHIWLLMTKMHKNMQQLQTGGNIRNMRDMRKPEKLTVNSRDHALI